MLVSCRVVRIALGCFSGMIALPSGTACSRASVPVRQIHSGSSPIRDVRVRIFSDASRVRFQADALVRVHADKDNLFDVESDGTWTTVTSEEGHLIRLGKRSAKTAEVSLVTVDGSPLSVSLHESDGWGPVQRYPGALRIEVKNNGRLRGINLVDIEDYIGCVVGWEAWPTFEMAALRAQAIAARTYALDQMIRRNELNHDLSATQGSQVYKGIRDDKAGKRARQATNQTRGVVCTWGEDAQERMFPAYYSAVCGGMSQSAAIFGKESDVPPLAGGVKCDYCKIAPGETYRWGPVRIELKEVRSKLRSRIPGLSSISRMEVGDRTPDGRPVVIRVIDAKGSSYNIQAERLRHALGPSRIKSTDFNLRVEGRSAVFSHGRGFGHGLGFCQWGAQGQALKGKKAAEILRYYYPGSKLARAY